MTVQWVFRESTPHYKNRQPNQGEFFATGAIKSNTEALVRESVQNSIDAHLPGNPVHVRFHLAAGEYSLDPIKAQFYFNGAWEHFEAEGNGLDDVPKKDDACPYIVVEDFGTTGLTGDIREWQYEPDAKNPFYYFFRAEGLSGKSAEELGRWGIGKYVFPRSSRIKSFIALTIRHDDSKQLLMGQSILKSHKVGDKHYTPDADFGEKDPSIDGLIIPVNDHEYIRNFREDFKLKRNNESGLSVVVPWVDQELTRDALVMAIIENFFYTVLNTDLRVTVSSGGNDVVISRETLKDVCCTLDEDFQKRMLPLIRIADWARMQDDSKIVCLNPANPRKPEWVQDIIPSEKLKELRERFRVGEMLAVKVPLTVNKKRQLPCDSWFHMYLHNNEDYHCDPIYIRSGNIISDVRGIRVPDVCSLVVVNHTPFAQLLGDSENPAHTQWEKDSSNFKNVYNYGSSYITFMKQCVAYFVRFLNATDEELDKELLRDIFFLPIKPEPTKPKDKSKPRKANTGTSPTPSPFPEPKKQRYTLSRVSNGFTVTQGTNPVDIPSILVVRVAYDRRRGNPWKKYDPADFMVTESPIRVEWTGLEQIDRSLNILRFNIINTEFRLTVKGFDENRDLIVDIDVTGGDDASED